MALFVLPLLTTTISANDEKVKVVSGTTAEVKIEKPLSNRELIEQFSEQYKVNSTLALKIASCESGLTQFNSDGSVFRGRQNPQDVGIFQINEYYHLKRSQELGLNIYTREGNIEFAMILLSTTGTSPWNWSKACWGS